MKNIFLAVLMSLPLVACQQTSSNLEKKVDDLAKDVAEIKTLVKSGAAAGARPGAGQQPQQPRRPTADPSKTYAVNVDGDPFDGPADAKVTIVKGYDYACPYCDKVRPTMEDLRKKYGNDVRVVYKQFVVHPQVATAPALAVCAAAKQGKFNQMDTAVWETMYKTRNYDKAVTAPTPAGAPPAAGAPPKQTQCWEDAAGCPIILAAAKTLGLDAAKLQADMKGDCVAAIQKDQRDLQVMGMSATPGFFINGRNLSGAQPIEAFSALIDEELKKANDRIAQGTKQADYYKTWVVDKGEKAAAMPQ